MTIYLSLGANLGNREETINKALELLSEQVGPLIKRSSFYYSEPWGFDSPNEFCNLCASFQTSLSPLDLLHTTQSIERQLGRTHKSQITTALPIDRNHKSQIINYSDRVIDIDIIRVFDRETEIFINTPELTIPHRFWTQRDFVKFPLNEILQ